MKNRWCLVAWQYLTCAISTLAKLVSSPFFLGTQRLVWHHLIVPCLFIIS
uniref:Uncharacterized protein n=1 Tax=Arundo donax TaxID=35708 RepID=A0A0A9HA73_ARUDO